MSAAAPTKVAPCGCAFTGRVYSYQACTVLDLATVTGGQAMRHAMRAEKKAVAA